MVTGIGGAGAELVSSLSLSLLCQLLQLVVSVILLAVRVFALQLVNVA